MKPGDDSDLVKMPSSLLAEVQAAANEEHRNFRSNVAGEHIHAASSK